MILREYLYVDTDKVRSMLAQLEGGVAEESRRTEKGDKQSDIGVKGYLGHNRTWGTEEYLQKSLGDAWFPLLEEALESEQAIRDISDLLQDEEVWTSEEFRSEYPPGSIIRVSAPGFLFDAQYVARALGGFSTTYQGYTEFAAESIAAALSAVRGSQPKPRKGAQGGRPSAKKSQASAVPQNLEDEISDFPPLESDGFSLTPGFLRSLVKISRGMYRPGLHLTLMPTENDELTVNIRLQEGRQYLDSDVEILFSRYGIGLQEWTVVGSIGYYAEESPSMQVGNTITNENDELIRPRLARQITAMVSELGNRGFTDIARYPSFTVVPFAVYRSIPTHDVI